MAPSRRLTAEIPPQRLADHLGAPAVFLLLIRSSSAAISGGSEIENAALVMGERVGGIPAPRICRSLLSVQTRQLHRKAAPSSHSRHRYSKASSARINSFARHDCVTFFAASVSAALIQGRRALHSIQVCRRRTRLGG